MLPEGGLEDVGKHVGVEHSPSKVDGKEGLGVRYLEEGAVGVGDGRGRGQETRLKSLSF